MNDEDTTITVSFTPKQAEALVGMYYNQEVSESGRVDDKLVELLSQIIWRIKEQLYNLQP